MHNGALWARIQERDARLRLIREAIGKLAGKLVDKEWSRDA